MWLLKKLDGGPVKYLISENKTYTVGRKNCDIILEEDASISRKHCVIYIAKQSECPFAVSTFTGVWIADEQSKYGTYLKSNSSWVKITPHQDKKLTSGSILKFGLMENIWSLEFKPIVACTSGIQAEQRKEIEASLQSIDGCLKNVWCKECSLVVVNEITLTIKVVLALINGVPIVTPDYVAKVVEAVRNATALPDDENYRPAIKESILDVSLVSLDTKKNRKELFKGMKFLIPTKKQLETLREVIVSAGGTAEMFSFTGNWERLTHENSVLIQLPVNSDTVTEEMNKSFKEITSLLKNNYGKRVIPESEIAQAIAYSSTEKYCNPKSTCFNLLRAERHIDPGVLLVEETPEYPKVNIPEPCVIPCSATIESMLHRALYSQSSGTHEEQESEKSLESRKRTHSLDQLDEDVKAKKARAKQSCNDSSAERAAVAGSTTLQKKCNVIESGSSGVKKSAAKTTCITSFFPKIGKAVQENASVVPKPSDPKFWDESQISNERSKRKLPKEKDDSGESLNRKRAKIPEVSDQKQFTSAHAIQTTRKVVEAVEKANQPGDSAPSFSCRKTSDVEAESDLADYIERGKVDALNRSMDELNCTIFSLTLISSVYLKDDGSLVDPPSVPVNVKKFKKQQLHSRAIVAALEENEDELSDGEWLEPHSGRLNISVGDGEDW